MSSKAVATEMQLMRDVILPAILKSGKLVENYTAQCADTFRVRDIQMKFIGSDEAMMLTICYHAVVDFEFAGVADKRAFFVKKTPKLPLAHYDEIQFEALFHNEIEAYDKIVPALEEFAGRRLITTKNYYSVLERDFAMLVLDDFTAQGWRMPKALVNLSLAHVLIAVKYLAQLHAIGFAYRRRRPIEFATLTSTLKEARFGHPIENCEWLLMERYGLQRLLKTTQQHQAKVEASFLQRVGQLLSDFYAHNKQRVLAIEPYVTLCHGDYLRNNVAFKYATTANDEVPLAVMMFDLQTLRVSSPMLDLATFLAISAFAAVRHTHFARIFDTYCAELDATYVSLAAEATPAFLSRAQLIKEYIRYLPYSISISASFLQVLIEPPVETFEELMQQQRTNEAVIEDALKRGGAAMDVELAHQMREMYDLSRQFNVDIGAGIEL